MKIKSSQLNNECFNQYVEKTQLALQELEELLQAPLEELYDFEFKKSVKREPSK